MAAPTNYDQTNQWLAEVDRRVGELIAILKAGIDVGQSGTLGNLALINTLSEAPMGNLQTMQQRLQVQNVAGREMVGRGPRLMQEGAFGLGSSGRTILDGAAPNNRSEIWEGDGGNASGFPSVLSYWPGIDLYRSSSNRCVRIMVGNVGMVIRCWTGNSQHDDVTVYTTYNTTRDSNGTLRAASPIFRVANTSQDAAGDGFAEAGAGMANGEAQGVTAEHIETGVYVINGSMGFAKDNVWPNGFVIPQDANGNNLVFAEASEDDSGTITVRTFEPKFDWRTGRHIGGDPMDIPENRWIDLRLSMPEPAPDPEQPDEPEPEQEQADPTDAA